MTSLARVTYRHDRATVQQHSESGDWTRHGVIHGRAWPSGFTEDEYLLMLSGGTRDKQQSPDGFTRNGVPFWIHSEQQQRMIADDLDRHCLERFESTNIACDEGRQVILSFLAGLYGITGVEFFAVGIGNPVDPTSSDATLVSEVFRKAFTSSAVSGNTVLFATYFSLTEGNYVYTEAGLFGNGASSDPNSGMLFAHAQYAYEKTNTVALTNDYNIYLN